MPIIFISSLPFGGGERLARKLAESLGYGFLSREDVVAKANEYGVPVGKLEVAMVKRPAVQERLARLKERYLAVATAVLCERAREGNLVYYGRAGHHLLPGVSHVLRVHVIPDPVQRLETAAQRIKLPEEKARKFLEEVDEDIRAWVRFVHGANLDDPSRYDYVVNLERTSLENAAAVLCTVAGLPDYQPTPASQKVMEDRLLQARARIQLVLDEGLADADLTVRASDGVVTVTYMPRQAHLAPRIADVLKELPECREVRCTMASTNILWIQERFDPASEVFRHVTELARRWGAAVELLQYRSGGEEGEVVPVNVAPAAALKAGTGGVEDDLPEAAAGGADRSFERTLEALVQEGRSGGGHTVAGGRDRLLGAISRSVPYSLVVVGDLFLDKSPAARTRMTRELAMFLTDHVKAPILSTADLSSKLHLGRREVLKSVAAGALLVLLYCAIFLRQEGLLNVLGGEAHKAAPWVASILVALLAPVVSVLYGTLLASAMKWLKMD
ncbi:MAG: AAA family ATPase [Acidobacteriota bacterium]